MQPILTPQRKAVKQRVEWRPVFATRRRRALRTAGDLRSRAAARHPHLHFRVPHPCGARVGPSFLLIAQRARWMSAPSPARDEQRSPRRKPWEPIREIAPAEPLAGGGTWPTPFLKHGRGLQVEPTQYLSHKRDPHDTLRLQRKARPCPFTLQVEQAAQCFQTSTRQRNTGHPDRSGEEALFCSASRSSGRAATQRRDPLQLPWFPSTSLKELSGNASFQSPKELQRPGVVKRNTV